MMPAVDQWNPLETAPRDGTMVLLCYVDGDGKIAVRVAAWRYEVWMVGYRFQVDWGAVSRTPLFWMPVPSIAGGDGWEEISGLPDDDSDGDAAAARIVVARFPGGWRNETPAGDFLFEGYRASVPADLSSYEPVPGFMLTSTERCCPLEEMPAWENGEWDARRGVPLRWRKYPEPPADIPCDLLNARRGLERSTRFSFEWKDKRVGRAFGR